MSLDRNARGKRPHFFTPATVETALEHQMSMILVLAEELSAMRDRLDTVERVATDAGLADAIEAYQPPQPVLEAREARRQAFLARLYYLARKDAAEAAENDTAQRYAATLDDIARG